MKRFIPFSFIEAVQTEVSGADTYTTLDDDDFQKSIASPDDYLLDVRHPDEYKAGHIAGASNLDVMADDFITKAKEQIPDDKTIAVYCGSGKRSALASAQLAANGFKVLNLDGGLQGWEKAGMPVTTD